jgi:hypothetical protein
MESITTTDILAILLAFFSMGLALFFYFKSSEESNRFYTNSYEFTKDTSEMLGRIEAGFGERLRHIDEGYSHISQRFDDIIVERDKTVKNVEREQEDVDKIIEEKQRMIESLLAKTDLQEVEKHNVLKTLSEKDKQLQIAQSQLEKYKSTLEILEKETQKTPELDIPQPIQSILSVLGKAIGPKHFKIAPHDWLNTKIKPLIMVLSDYDKKLLQEFGVVDSQYDLTLRGRQILRDFSFAFFRKS